MRIDCIRDKPKLIGKGIHRKVYKVKNLVLKIEKRRLKNFEELRRRAVMIDSRQRKLREELTFLPKYYGAVLAKVEGNGTPSSVVITFHEYVKPLPTYSIRSLWKIFSLFKKAIEKGYMLDMKPSNFGRKGRRVLYLDEYGISKGLLPSDVLEDLINFNQFVLKKLRLREVKEGKFTSELAD